MFNLKKLPDSPGVYLFKNARGKVIYVGRATSLKKRVAQYFARRESTQRPITDALHEVAKVDTIITPTVLEAVILEANLIKRYWPKYNVKDRDDRSFVYLAITKDEYPKLIIKRGAELARLNFAGQNFWRVFGPFFSLKTLGGALRILRRIFSWSNCTPGAKRACFYYHLGQCPGICTGEIDAADYRRQVIKNITWFFVGRKNQIILSLKKEMQEAAKKDDFEKAAHLRNQIFSLEHIQDIALIERNTQPITGYSLPVTRYPSTRLLERIEGYDISNISGQLGTGSMVVWQGSGLAKSEYRKFRIKTVSGSNDVAMLTEVLRRRFQNHTRLFSAIAENRRVEWSRPSLILVDGGKPQVNAARRVLKEFNLDIPVVGIAKGPTRKKDEFIFDERSLELGFLVRNYPHVLKRVRDEAHRFAIKYYRQLRRIKD